MKVIVFSDSHGQTNELLEIISKYQDIDKIIHLGDLVKDAERLQYEYPDIEMICIAGNNDWYSKEPTERLIELCGIKFLISHGDYYGVKNGLVKITQRAKQLGAEAVLFGHTHVPFEGYEGDVLLINPGSISLPARGSRRSYCVIDITSEGINASFNKL